MLDVEVVMTLKRSSEMKRWQEGARFGNEKLAQ
jgi:hypothetical protein